MNPLSSSTTRTYTVSGMTCDHCVLSVTEEVIEVAGVDGVSVDLASGALTVTGDGFSDEAVGTAVAEAGYEVIGVSPSTKHFIRHYAEMVVAMMLGMAVLGVPAEWALNAVGSSWSQLTDDAPALMLLGMATTMTVPMVGWMRHRGHGWRANTEMSASMYLPTFAVIALLWAGMVEDIGTLLVIEHVAMLLAMLAAMLLRPAEYRCAAHGRQFIATEVTA